MGKKNLVTILGLGNILLGDEGFGVHFIRRFAERYTLPEGVEALDGGTLGYSLLDPIGKCHHLIVVDVLKVEDLPGSMYRFTREELELQLPPPTTAHEVMFLDVLCKAEMIEEAPEEVLFLCVVPQEYGDTRLEMTGTLLAKLDEMERLLLKELSDHGVTPARHFHA